MIRLMPMCPSFRCLESERCSNKVHGRKPTPLELDYCSFTDIIHFRVSLINADGSGGTGSGRKMMIKEFPRERAAKRQMLLASVDKISETLRASGPKSEELGTLAPEAVSALRDTGM